MVAPQCGSDIQYWEKSMRNICIGLALILTILHTYACTGIGTQLNEVRKRFVDNGDGTVADSTSGLLWKKCTEGQQNDASCSGSVSAYLYCNTASNACDDTVTLTTGLSGSIYATCNSLNSIPSGGFAKKTTWRVPTKDELKSLVYCSNGPTIPPVLAQGSGCNSGSRTPVVDPDMFPNTASNAYWSASSYASAYAWAVNFSNTMETAYTKTAIFPLRCVSTWP